MLHMRTLAVLAVSLLLFSCRLDRLFGRDSDGGRVFRFSGRVVDAEGKPVPDAEVTLKFRIPGFPDFPGIGGKEVDGKRTKREPSFVPLTDIQRVFADVRGRYAIETSRSGKNFVVWVQRPGYMPGSSKVLDFKTGGTSKVEDLVLCWIGLGTIRLHCSTGTKRTHAGKKLHLRFRNSKHQVTYYLDEVTDEKGVVLLRLEPGLYRMRATGEGLAEIEKDVEIEQDRESHVELPIPSACRVEGRVVDQNGDPVPKAVVGWELFTPEWSRGKQEREKKVLLEPYLRGQARADENGRFALEKVPCGKRKLSAWAWGFRPSESPEIEFSKGKHVTGLGIVLRHLEEIPEGYGIIEATLRWAGSGQPVADSEVGVTLRIGTGHFNETAYFHHRTDEKGRVLIYWVKEGKAKLEFKVKDRPLPAPLTAEVPDRGRVKVECCLHAGKLLCGLVLSHSGDPVGEATVKVWPLFENRYTDWRNGRKAMTDRDGVFTFENMMPGPLLAVAIHEEAGWTRIDEVRVETWERGKISVRLSPWNVATGRVLDRQGNPIADAKVKVDSAHGHHSPLVNYRQFRALGLDFDEAHTARTDDEGKFRVGCLIHGPHHVEAEREDFYRKLGDRIELPAGGGETRAPELELKRRHRGWGRIVFEVFEPGGVQPAVSATIEVRQYYDRTWTFKTDEKGHAVMEKAPAEADLDIAVWKKGFAGREIAGFRVGQEEERTLRVELHRGGAIEGLVAGEDGNPKTNARIAAFPGDRQVGTIESLSDLFQRNDGPPSFWKAVAGPDGRYRIELIPPGTYTVAVAAEKHTIGPARWQTLGVIVEEGRVTTGIDFLMFEKGTIRGRIDKGLFSLEGKWEVFLKRTRKPGTTSLASEDLDGGGEFVFQDIPPGDYIVKLWIYPGVKEGFRGVHDMEFLPGQDLDLYFPIKVVHGREARVDFTFPEGGSLSGRVLSLVPEVKPRHVHIQVVGPSASFDIQPEEDGSFEFPYVIPGEYEVKPCDTNFLTDSVPRVRVFPGKKVEGIVVQVTGTKW